MKTYAETKGKEPIDYRSELESESPDWTKIGKGSMNFLTDPAGQLPPSVKRYENGRPDDNQLTKLVMEFNTHALKRDKKGCLALLDKIENRAAELK